MSTDKQATPGQYDSAEASGEVGVAAGDEPAQRPSWAPEEAEVAGGVCLNCESHVTSDFARVCGDNDNQVHHCQHCVSGAELAAGAAADPDYEHYHDRGVPKR